MEINSLSSGFVLGTTLYRNQCGGSNKLIAQVGYALSAMVATAESITALVFSALTLFAYPFSSEPFNRSTEWLSSSAFALGWSVTDFCLNLFVYVLVADEKSARKILQSGNLMIIPPGAVL